MTGPTMGALGAVRRLDGEDRRLAAEAAQELARASLLLRTKGWGDASRGLLSVAGREDAAEVDRVQGMVDRVADHLPWHPTCLRRSLATQKMLARRGVGGVVKFTMPDPAAGREGHAWVEPITSSPGAPGCR